MPDDPIAVLEIGTTKVLAVVGEMTEGDRIMVTGVGRRPASGVRKGEIVDFENALVCVKSALQAAEESGKIDVHRVFVSISGGHVQSMVSRGLSTILESRGEVTQADVENVIRVAEAVNLSVDRYNIHSINQQFYVDDGEPVSRPEGMSGARLALDMLIIHVLRNSLTNIVKVVNSANRDVDGQAFSGLCSALAVLSPEQKRSGVILIDLGGGTTDYYVYTGNVPAAAGALAVGGDHVTNDISVGLGIPLQHADRLKCEAASAVLDLAGSGQRLTLPPEGGFSGRSVSLNALHTIVSVRMEELFQAIRRRLAEQKNILHRIGAGVVLTGGGAQLRGACELAERVFGMPCMVGRPRNVGGMSAEVEGPDAATALGLLQYAHRVSGSSDESGRWGKWLKSLLGF